MTNKSIFPCGFVSPEFLSGKPKNAPILLGFSGGPDSAALLSLLLKWRELTGAPIYAAHIDHMIRDGEHERDRKFCERVTFEGGVKLFTLIADLPKIARESGESLETAARRVRYGFFNKIMKENGIEILATAHNADDNLETILLNLTRGSGLKGMRGIPPTREIEGGTVIRPILGMSKDEILAYCEENSVEYVIDSTNAVADCSRNIIRLKVIPELKSINPSVVKTAKRLSDSVRDDEKYFDELADSFLEGKNDFIALDALGAIPDVSVKTRIIQKLGGSGLETVHIESILKLAEKGEPHSSVSLPDKKRAVIENGRLVFEDDTKESPAEYTEIQLKEGENPFFHSVLRVSSQSERNVYKSETQAAIASDKIIGSLVARNRQAGDRIFLRGMHRSVKKLLCDAKIPLELRDKLPIVCDGDGIVFIPYIGVRDGMSAKNSEKKTYITLISGYNKEEV